MKVLKYLLIGLIVALVLFATGLFFFLNNLKKGALPDYNARFFMPGIAENVTVYRDAHAIPHVYAQSESDLYRAVGYIMAQDRMWQMDLLRRVTMGRLSELFGADLADADHLMRSLRITEKSKKLLEETDPEILAVLEAYSDGVNRYIQKHALPPEFKILGYHPEPWEPYHSLNLIGYMAWDLTLPWENEILLEKLRVHVGESMMLEAIPDLQKQPTAIFPDLGRVLDGFAHQVTTTNSKLQQLGIEIFHGSNNWAVSGSRSTTGKPLLANDMHLGLNIPGIWYQMHHHVEGGLNVTGVVLPGQPWVISGHNDSIAWGMTNVMVDDMDFYAEVLNDDSTQYLLDGEWHDLIIRKEVINFKDGDTIERTIRFTHRGPIINGFKKLEGQAVSMRWIGNEWSNEIASVYKLNRATNWETFRAALKTFIAVSQNVVYADHLGNIGLQTSSGIPVRPGHKALIYPGHTSEFDWQGLVPFEELPHEFNPERGYVSSANNKTAPDDYPYHISHWFAQPDRMDRIRELLEEQEKFSVVDFKRIQGDFQSALAKKTLNKLLPRLQNYPSHKGEVPAVLDLLSQWDYQLLPSSIEASIFEVFFRKLIESLVRDNLTDDLFRQFMGSKIMAQGLLNNILANPDSEWIDDITTPEVETFDDIISIALQSALEELTETLGPDMQQWEWQKLNHLSLAHPLGSVSLLNRVLKLNRGPYPVGGSFHTVAPYTYSWNNLYKTDNGASQRHVYAVGFWDESRTVIPTGTSGIPASPYYCDQTPLYVAHEYHSDFFTLGKVKENSRYTMIIKPWPGEQLQNKP